MPRSPFAFHEVVRLGALWVLVRLFVFYEVCFPLPMGEGPGVRSGLGEAFCFL